MSKEKESIEFMAGDKLKLPRPDTKAEFFAAYLDGVEGAIYYDHIYQVSGNKKTDLVDNFHSPLPLLDKEFVNHPVFNGLFSRVEEPENND